MTEVNFRRIFKEYQESGLTMTDYCHNMNYSRTSFYHWRKKWRKDSIKSVPLVRSQENRLIPINIVDTTTDNITNPDNPTQTSLSSKIDVVLPNGGKIVLSGEIDPSLFSLILNKL